VQTLDRPDFVPDLTVACTRPPRALLEDDRPGSCVSGCGEHQGDTGRRERGRAPWSRCRGRGCSAVEGIPGPRSRSNGLRRHGPRHGPEHRTERIVARRGPLGRRFPKPIRIRPARMAAPRIAACCWARRGAGSWLLASSNPIAARVHGCGLRRSRRLVAGGRGCCRTRRSRGANGGLQPSTALEDFADRVSVQYERVSAAKSRALEFLDITPDHHAATPTTSGLDRSYVARASADSCASTFHRTAAMPVDRASGHYAGNLSARKPHHLSPAPEQTFEFAAG
jgi:hypothetical protein